MLQDEDVNPDEYWDSTFSDQNLEDMFVVRQPFLLVLTARNMTVPVILDVLSEIDDERHQALLDKADHVIECSLECRTGKMVLIGNDYYPDAPRIQMAKSIYQAQIYFNKLNTLRENDLEGDDYYHIVLCPGAHIKAKVLKKIVASE